MGMNRQYGHREQNSQGFATVIAIMVVALLLGTGGSLLLMTATDARTSVNYRNGVMAQYIAEAGAKAGLVKFANDPTWYGFSDKQFYGEGYYLVQVQSGAGYYRIISDGRVKEAGRRVTVVFQITGSAGTPTVPLSQRIKIIQWNSY